MHVDGYSMLFRWRHRPRCFANRDAWGRRQRSGHRALPARFRVRSMAKAQQGVRRVCPHRGLGSPKLSLLTEPSNLRTELKTLQRVTVTAATNSRPNLDSVDRTFVSISSFDPNWLDTPGWLRRMRRMRLVTAMFAKARRRIDAFSATQRDGGSKCCT